MFRKKENLIESRKSKLIMPAKVDPDKCTGCGTCVPACPVECITMEDDKAVVDADSCIDCGACVSECPVEAITQE
jgi:NAD-dependent dihydropyrimidine dehydrogenase PreA subunit